LLLIESREAKKTPQEEDQTKDKQKSTPVEANGDTSNESPVEEESKDGE